MKRFRFTMETVRRLRQQEEELVQAELAAVLAERASVQAALDESLGAEQDLYTYLRGDGLSVADIEHVTRYGMLHRRRIMDARVQLANTDAAVNRVRARLVEAQQRREMLDQLESKQREQHRRGALAEEARELDEIGSRTSGRGAMRGLGAVR